MKKDALGGSKWKLKSYRFHFTPKKRYQQTNPLDTSFVCERKATVNLKGNVSDFSKCCSVFFHDVETWTGRKVSVFSMNQLSHDSRVVGTSLKGIFWRRFWRLLRWKQKKGRELIKDGRLSRTIWSIQFNILDEFYKYFYSILLEEFCCFFLLNIEMFPNRLFMLIFIAMSVNQENADRSRKQNERHEDEVNRRFKRI